MEKNKNVSEIFPLADRLRPVDISDFTGQEHLTGPGKIVRSFIDKGYLSSLIFWGPPGTGKTTLSRILVKQLDLPSSEFSATVSKIGEIRDLMKKSADMKKVGGKPLVLFVDEIHHFNRHIQDAFLPYVESGDIILMGTTTENPAYKMNRALLSRLRVLEFNPLSEKDMGNIIDRGLEFIRGKTGSDLKQMESDLIMMIELSNGDGRRLLNILELVFNSVADGDVPDTELVKDIVQKKIGSYDRTGDDRYAYISALHKAVRNSDIDSSLFWLYRMMEGGEDPLFIIRRMIRMAVEDIGFADPDALPMCLNIKEAYEALGSPEGDLFLTQGIIYLSSAPKSNSIYKTEKKMKKIIEKYGDAKVPFHIINPSNFLNRRKGAGKGYTYAHDHPKKTTTMDTMAEGVKESDFFEPNTMGFEKKIRDRLEYWKKIKKEIRETEGDE